MAVNPKDSVLAANPSGLRPCPNANNSPKADGDGVHPERTPASAGTYASVSAAVGQSTPTPRPAAVLAVYILTWISSRIARMVLACFRRTRKKQVQAATIDMARLS